MFPAYQESKHHFGIWLKRPKTKTSKVICQNITIFVSQNFPCIFSVYLIKLKIVNIFYTGLGTSFFVSPLGRFDRLQSLHLVDILSKFGYFHLVL